MRGLHTCVPVEVARGGFGQRRVATFYVDLKDWKKKGKGEPVDKSVNASPTSIPLPPLAGAVLKHACFMWPR